MALSEEELEQLIVSQLSKELTSDIDIPDIEEQWQNIKQKIVVDNKITHKGNTRLTRKRVVFAAAAILLSIASLNFLSYNANAFGNKIAEYYNHIVGKTTQDKTETFRQPNDPAPPKVQNLSANEEKEVTLEQAQSSVPFKLVIPNYLPEGTKTKRVLLTPLGSDVYQVSIEYNISNQLIIFSQQNSANGVSRGSLYDTDDTTVKNLTINGYPATLFMSKNSVNTIEWQDRGLILQIRGIITEENMTKIANSIK
ncbi:DUF4367 domain-containing protein [Desulfosporosinus sp. SYSU MS00001]|uniref:DUF4367 domain-containing protein n=1 Tax=Desulfosporosinus sp. SYSU MS00001 TaxID=3416284 RepID=UPI003CEF9D28